MKPLGEPPPPPPPLPPPLVSHRPTTMDERPSTYLASLEAAGPDFMNTAVYVPMIEKPIEPVWYFFYGTLTDPAILKHILDLEEEPLLRPAKVIGYEVSSWGQYPALVDGEPGAVVLGSAYKVQTTEHEYKLARYETNAYRLHGCQIEFTDDEKEQPREIAGNTFMYAGDAAALRAGEFDCLLWELQMGVRLPETWKTPTEEILWRMGIEGGGGSTPSSDQTAEGGDPAE
ncbi:hypothetical protein HD806DRAFT_26414 [Xylariaceae sp. AK1471]|nr:hypothetical protein HD806DRAFT_26414 [Xylariaceae sp. AK1471]